LPELGKVNPSAASTELLAQPAIVAKASIVDLSRLGQLLSASALLQQAGSQATGAVDAVGEQGASVNLDDGFGRLLAAAQLFVDAYNQFQSGDVSEVQDPLTAPFDNVLLLAINELPGVENGKTLLSSLQQVGIGFQENASDFIGSAQLTIDATALQSAFNASPAGTSALLAQAFQTIGVLAVQLAGQPPDLFMTGTDVALPAGPFDVLPVALPSISAAVDATVPGALAAQAALTANLALVTSAPGSSVAPLAAVAPQAMQASPLDQSSDLAANPDSPPMAVALNAQAAASSALPVSSFDVSPNLVPNLAPPASPAGSLNAADAVMQSVLADQALRNALDANLVPAAVAPAYAPVIAAPAGGEENGPDQVPNPSAIPEASVATAAGVAPAPLPQAQVPVQQAKMPLQQAQVPVQQAQVPAPLAALDDGSAPLALDPSVAAAVAAYRLGDGALGVPGSKPAAALSEPDADISAVGSARSLDLDLQDGSSMARRNETAHNAVLALEENKALAATRLQERKTVDIAV
jgi:hypothetical protein